MGLGRGRRHPLQGGGVGVDAERRATAAGVGRSGGAPAWLRLPWDARSLPAAARPGADRLPLRAPGERPGARALRLDRDAAAVVVPVADLLTSDRHAVLATGRRGSR